MRYAILALAGVLFGLLAGNAKACNRIAGLTYVPAPQFTLAAPADCGCAPANLSFAPGYGMTGFAAVPVPVPVHGGYGYAGFGGRGFAHGGFARRGRFGAGGGGALDGLIRLGLPAAGAVIGSGFGPVGTVAGSILGQVVAGGL